MSLPIDAVLPDILSRLRGHRNLVLRAPTGAGKTTRVPPALLDDGLAGDRRVVLLEPRRVAARAAARRMAGERGSRLGGEVGYQVRFERRAGDETRLLVVTEGIVVAMLQSDPFLEDSGALIFDELHERNLDSDLALAMARRVQRQARPDLRLVVMSATLEPGPVADWLGDAAVVVSEGRRHPVEIRYADRPDDRRVEARAASAVRRVLAEEGTDRFPDDGCRGVLVFLPGVGEIRRTAEYLKDLADVRVLALYGDLPPADQDAALAPSDRRKVVLATNVAETSVTVEGIRAVIDTGLARSLRFDPGSGLDRLVLGRISRVSADQRAGRAGRLGPGLCLRLWTRHEDRSLAERETPEIRRVDLAGPVLQLLAWGERDLAAFDWLEPPDPAVVERALELLGLLGAVRKGHITELGRAMARLPVHPRLARLTVAGHRRGVRRQTARLAALLSDRDIRRTTADGPPVSTSPSDLLDRLGDLARFEEDGRGAGVDLRPGRVRNVLRAARQLERIIELRLGRPEPPADDEDGAVLRSILEAYPDRVVRRREPGGPSPRFPQGDGGPRGRMTGGRGVRLSAASAVRDAELFVAVELDDRRGEQREARVRLASAVDAAWLATEVRDEVVFDEERERVVGRRQTLYRDLVIAEREIPADPADAERVLARAALAGPDRALALDDPAVASFLTRLRCLAAWMPELGLPRFEAAELGDLLPALCAGRRSFAELRRAPLADILRGALGRERLAALDRHAPERVTVPSGSRVRLRYEPGRPPVLAVRIQEMFGLRETPRIAGGRVAVLLHLLAPNQRPQQVTRDLESFWRNTYPGVRKDLRGRYPRHPWPEDPMTAKPVAGGKGRRSGKSELGDS